MKKAFYTILTFAVIIFVWYQVSLTANPLFVPNPLIVLDDFKILLSNGTIFTHLFYTFKRIMIATCLSGAIALPLELFIRNSKIAKATVYPDVINKFIQGSLMAADKYNTEFDAIKAVMPMFSTASNDDIIANCTSAKLTTWKDNENLLTGSAKIMYTDMCNVWKSIGEEANADLVDSIFTDTYIQNIAGEFSSTAVSVDTDKTKVTEENKQIIADTEALLGGTASVTFIKNTSKFSDSEKASEELDKFIDIAKILDGTIIEIAGNSDPQDEYNKKLSAQRAEAVKNYFIMNGISADRIVTVGNGSSNPVVENDTEEHRAMNRRTDVSFKIIEQ